MTTSTKAPAESSTALRKRGRVAYISQFIKQPFVIGAIAPSSPQLARRIIQGLGLDKASVVVEFGPGTGVCTDEILPRLGPNTRFLAIERNQGMYDEFRRRHPGTTIVNDSAENARAICEARGMLPVDCIVSGLPWASFPDDLQDRLLDAILSVLKPGGDFVTFGYHIGTWLKAGKRFYAELPKRFERVERSEIVWQNFPPAFVVRSTKAR